MKVNFFFMLFHDLLPFYFCFKIDNIIPIAIPITIFIIYFFFIKRIIKPIQIPMVTGMIISIPTDDRNTIVDIIKVIKIIIKNNKNNVIIYCSNQSFNFVITLDTETESAILWNAEVDLLPLILIPCFNRTL